MAARALLPKTIAKREAQHKATKILYQLSALVSDLDRAEAKTAAAKLDDIVNRLYRWTVP